MDVFGFLTLENKHFSLYLNISFHFGSVSHHKKNNSI